MVRHDDKCIEDDRREVVGDLAPAVLDYSSYWAELHPVVFHEAEQAAVVAYAQGHEVRPGSGVIEAW
jgi:hypothetical protein